MRNKLFLSLSICLVLVGSVFSFPASARYLIAAQSDDWDPAAMQTVFRPQAAGMHVPLLSGQEERQAEKSLPPKAVQPVRYIVKPGDTLYRIAHFFGISVDSLMLENRIADPTLLQIGRKLIVPQHAQEVSSEFKGSRQPVVSILNATLTAYTAGPESTGKKLGDPQYGITYSGTKAREGRTIAVDPATIPLGSTVYIEGIGIRQAEDIGSAIKGNHIDVYMTDVDRALRFGVKKHIKVYVLSTDGEQKVS